MVDSVRSLSARRIRGAEKEGFEPSRRFSRPTPFPGEPLRPAWVFLHADTYKSKSLFNYSNPFQRVPFRPDFRHVSSYSLIRSGEDGIRTHVPVRTNGFQDRRVMTTSLPLQTVAQHLLKSWFAFDSLARTNDILTDSHSSVNANFKNYLNKNV